ncbi:MAG: hypothetical protein HYT40_01080 [Candidatus Sungbacteria bacterium]|uniref:LiaI-LiaF-like transmembrane region domain-containing protein n=1 Tax=Candidatus Sungiibacteriota bacterium TaxID=2750080 RepID=A0A931SBC7_9BACT|nr:hypothetical protein [Candidatus Sungbacteria bacterium]
MDTQHLTEQYRTFKRRHLLWPTLLILAGAGLLLENFGVLPPLTFAKLWPLLLVVWGLDMLWRRLQEHSSSR